MSSDEQALAGDTVVNSADEYSPGNSTDGQADSDEFYDSDDEQLIDKMNRTWYDFHRMVFKLMGQRRQINQQLSDVEIESLNRQISSLRKLAEQIWNLWNPNQSIGGSDKTLENVGVTVEHVLETMVNRLGLICGLVATLQNLRWNHDSQVTNVNHTFADMMEFINQLEMLAEKLNGATSSGQTSSSRYIKKKRRQETLLTKLLKKTVKC